LARKKYVEPAISSGKRVFSIRVRDLLSDLQLEGLPGGHTPQICSALQTGKFLTENGLEIEEIQGPPSKQSPTVVVRYRVANQDRRRGTVHVSSEPAKDLNQESPEERAKRLGSRLRGLLKNELQQYGGGEAFLRWVRGYDEEDAA
jgi:hypothetical protein